MDPLKLLVSVIHNTESLQKGMDMKEAELSRERELSETYKKRSLVMMRELHAQEMQIKKILSMKMEFQSGMFMCVLISTLITLYMNLVGVDDEELQPEEVLLEAKDEHKGDKVEILLEGEFYIFYFIICFEVHVYTGCSKDGSHLSIIILYFIKYYFSI